ncbi:MAG: SGNH/GDSL hydrolase family protein [Bacteroidota bacterium]
MQDKFLLRNKYIFVQFKVKKMKLLFFGLAVFFGQFLTAQTAAKKFISAADAKFSYVGRFDFSNAKQPAFMYSGSAIKAVFSGTSVEMEMKDDNLRNYFTIIIDDSIFKLKTDKPAGIYMLAKDLPNKKHTLQIIRRTEWHGGDSHFVGLYLDAAKRLFKPTINKRSIEFIGDSYTCGYGNEGASKNEHFSYETENSYLSYGAITARALQADYIGICRSGIGMYQGYGGHPKFAMPAVYDEVINSNKLSWDFAAHQPSMVVIDLGSNDFSAVLDSVKFTTAYLDFLKRIRNNYPQSTIVCAAGPSGGGDSFDTQQSYIKAVVDAFGKDDKAVHYFVFSAFQMNGSDWHPNVAEHKKMSAELIPFLKSLLK